MTTKNKMRIPNTMAGNQNQAPKISNPNPIERKDTLYISLEKSHAFIPVTTPKRGISVTDEATGD